MTDLSAQANPQTGAPWAFGSATMLILGFSGMMIGLAVDLQSVPAGTIGSLCTRAHSLRDSVVLHASLLPWTNIFMFASGIAAACYSAWPRCDLGKKWRARYAPLLPYIGCSVAMLAGMFFSEWLAPQLARHFGLGWSLSAMIAAMATGMVCGMAFWTAIAAGVKGRLW
jgi:hypothetical protein